MSRCAVFGGGGRRAAVAKGGGAERHCHRARPVCCAPPAAAAAVRSERIPDEVRAPRQPVGHPPVPVAHRRRRGWPRGARRRRCCRRRGRPCQPWRRPLPTTTDAAGGAASGCRCRWYRRTAHPSVRFSPLPPRAMAARRAVAVSPCARCCGRRHDRRGGRGGWPPRLAARCTNGGRAAVGGRRSGRGGGGGRAGVGRRRRVGSFIFSDEEGGRRARERVGESPLAAATAPCAPPVPQPQRRRDTLPPLSTRPAPPSYDQCPRP